MSARLTCLHGHPWEPGTDAPAPADWPGVCPVCGAPFEVSPSNSRPPVRVRNHDDPDATLGAEEIPPDADDCGLTLSPEVAVAAAVRTSVPGYEILAELGRGGMGVVYKARHIELNRLVALKMILAGVHVSPRELARFRSEAAAVAALQHPNIVQIYEVGEHDGRPYFSLEFVDGGNLGQRLTGAPLPPRWSAQLIERLARTIHFAHQRGIVHRDLKPANILLGRVQSPRSMVQGPEQTADAELWTLDLGLWTIKITDFGLAKQTQSGAALTQSGTVLGTPTYMAPEQALGKNREVGPASDIYALGAILYEMLAGRPPFRADTSLDTMLMVASEEPTPLSRLQPRLSRDLETICLKCLHKEPWKRYPTAEALADDLHRYLTGEPIEARPVSTAERVFKWARRRPSLAALVLLAVSSALAGFALICWEWSKEKERGQKLLEAQLEKDGALARAETTLYFHRIALAEREFLANRVVRARQLLNECPPYLRQWEWSYLDRLCHTELLTLRGHENAVYQLAFSPDGRYLASMGVDQTIKVWDAVAGKLLSSRAEGVVRGRGAVLAFSPDSRQLYFAAVNHPIQVWDVAPARKAKVIPRPPGNLAAVAFGPDRRLLALGDRDGHLRVWDTQLGKARFQVRVYKSQVKLLAFSPGGSLVASADENGVIKLTHAHTGLELRNLNGPAGPVHVWESRTGKSRHRLPGHTKPVTCVAFSPGGRYLASAGQDRMIKLWDMTTGEEAFTLRGHGKPILCLAFSPSGRVIASAGEDMAVKIWDATSAQEVQSFRAHLACQAVAYRPDGKQLATADGSIKLWEPGNYDEPVRTFGGPEEFVESIAYDPTGRHLAAAGKKGLKIWDAATGKTVLTLRGSTDRERNVAYSPDGRLLASAGEDGSIRLWDPTDGRIVRVLTGHSTSVNRVAFSPDGRRLASAGLDRTVRLWDTATGEEVAVLRGHGGPVRALAFSPLGDYLASGGRNQNTEDGDGVPEGELKIWDARTGEELRTLPGHSAAITSLAFTPDGARLASGSEDLTVKLWDPALGQEVLTLRGSNGSAEALAFSPDGLTLVAVCVDQMVRLWNATPAQ